MQCVAMTETRALTRRRILQGAGLLAIGAWVWGVPYLARQRTAPMTFRTIPGAAPFRVLDRPGPVSAGAAIFAGLETTPQPFTGSLCDVLFGTHEPVSIAYFSDVNCPNCPRMENAVAAVAAQHRVPLIRHELPLLGDDSIRAARAILAARRQSKDIDLSAPLTHRPGPTTVVRLRQLAQEYGLDGDQLLADMNGPDVTAQLARNHAVARRLGIYGTPGTVIGRTLIMGVLPREQIAQIITSEQEMDPVTCS